MTGNEPARWRVRDALVVAGVVIVGVLLLQALRVATDATLADAPEGSLLAVRHEPAQRGGPIVLLAPMALTAGMIFSRTRAMRSALALILVGSISSGVVERWGLGYVTTYLQLSARPLRCNVADICICLGVVGALVLLVVLLVRHRQKRTA